MDSEIWSRLPEEILEHVLSLLPLKTFITLRTTSKHFQSLLFSPAFVSKHSPDSPLFSFIVLSHPQFGTKCPLFDTARNKWRTLPLPFSPILKNTSGHPSSSSVLMSISNGRLCFSHSNPASFVVSSLFPPSIDVVKSPKIPSSYESLSFVSTCSGYNLLMLTSFGSSKTALVYDSKIHTWKGFDGFDQSLYNQEGVQYQGLLYFITPEPFQIACLDLESGIWGRSVIELPGELAFAKLLASSDQGNENLYLIGGIGDNGISRSLKLWELSGENEEKNWVEIERLPEMMFRKFVAVCYHKYEHVYCFWHQGLICICCYTWPEILYYKVSRRSWHWLPKCPLLPEKWSCGFRWFSFAPQLCASA